MQKMEENLVTNNIQNQNETCIDCFKIKCKNCGWEPSEKQLTKILKGKLSACPDCGKHP